MTTDQVLSIARAVLQIIGTFLVTYSTVTGVSEQMWSTVTGGVLMIVPVIWGLAVHTKTGTIQAAAKLPEVGKIVTTPVIANQIPSEKVVAR